MPASKTMPMGQISYPSFAKPFSALKKGAVEGQRMGAEPLSAFFARMPRFALAFSGGCDSAYLLTAAIAAGCEVSAYLVKTAFQPSFELQDAQQVIREARRRYPHAALSFKVIELDILSQDQICSNPPLRCYLCKRFLLGEVQRAAREDGFDVLADGTNATDNPARRPGFQALAELGVVSPLRHAGMTKNDVRDASRALGIITADKPSFSCLATAVPNGKRLTVATLAQAAEKRGVHGGGRPWTPGKGFDYE